MEVTKEMALFGYEETRKTVDKMLKNNLFTDEGAKIARGFLSDLEDMINKLTNRG